MSDEGTRQQDAKDRLREQLQSARVGMLGVEGSHDHMQPMTHFADEDGTALYFITASDTDLVRQIGQGATAHYCLISKNHDYHACIEGLIEQHQNAAKLDELWSPMVGAFFEEGRDDPKVTLLKMVLREASIWESDDSVFKLGFEVAKSAMTDDIADVGNHVIVNFSSAA